MTVLRQKEGSVFEDSSRYLHVLPSLKMVIAVIKTFGWRVRTLDIKTAYLQGKEIYVRPLDEAKSNKALCLKKVYGLKDTAR